MYVYLLSGTIDNTLIEFWCIFTYESVCSQSCCNRLLTTQSDLRPSAGHLGLSLTLGDFI